MRKYKCSCGYVFTPFGKTYNCDGCTKVYAQVDGWHEIRKIEPELNIRQRIDKASVGYIEQWGRKAKWLYLGEVESRELEDFLSTNYGNLPYGFGKPEWCGMTVLLVNKESHIGVGS